MAVPHGCGHLREGGVHSAYFRQPCPLSAGAAAAMIVTMKILRCSILLFFMGVVVAEEYQLPEDVQEEIDEHRQRVSEIILEAKQDIQDSQDRMVKTLEKELKSQTRKGHFQNAIAINKKLEELKKEDEKAVDLFGDTSKLGLKPSRINILKVALADYKDKKTTEKQHKIAYDMVRHAQKMVSEGQYTIHISKEFAEHLPEGFTYNKAWIDYQVDDGPYIYLEARGPEFTVTIPRPDDKSNDQKD